MMSQNVSSRRVTTHKCSQCDYPDYHTQSRSARVIHTRTHTGERPHQCDLCQQEFSRKGILFLDRHILTHKKRLPCDLCVQ